MKNKKTAGYSNNVRLTRKAKKHEEAEFRNELWRSLTPEQQLAELDARHGVGQGASRQRARLAQH